MLQAASMHMMFDTIDNAKVSSSEKKFLRRRFVESVAERIAGGHHETSILTLWEELMHEVAAIAEKRVGVSRLRGLLRAHGFGSLARRVSELAKGRRMAAHPDVAIVMDVAQALRGLPRGSVQGEPIVELGSCDAMVSDGETLSCESIASCGGAVAGRTEEQLDVVVDCYIGEVQRDAECQAMTNTLIITEHELLLKAVEERALAVLCEQVRGFEVSESVELWLGSFADLGRAGLHVRLRWFLCFLSPVRFWTANLDGCG
jgi:hypothetical protein